MKIGIVGAGLFGCIIAKTLQEKADCKVTLFDCKKEYAASLASGMLIKPSWVSSLGKEIIDPSLDLLQQLYGITSLPFKVGPVETRAYQVDKSSVIKDESLIIEHQEVTDVSPTRIYTKFDRYSFNHIIVAAGIWCKKFVDLPKLVGKVGISFEFNGQVKNNFIKPWAPFKQVVAYNVPGAGFPRRVWAGDGSAILEKNWDTDREIECWKRVTKALGFKIVNDGIVGVRPYYPDVKPCYLSPEKDDLIVVTGGAKNGTLAAAWAANQILQRISK